MALNCFLLQLWKAHLIFPVPASRWFKQKEFQNFSIPVTRVWNNIRESCGSTPNSRCIQSQWLTKGCHVYILLFFALKSPMYLHVCNNGRVFFLSIFQFLLSFAFENNQIFDWLRVRAALDGFITVVRCRLPTHSIMNSFQLRPITTSQPFSASSEEEKRLEFEGLLQLFIPQSTSPTISSESPLSSVPSTSSNEFLTPNLSFSELQCLVTDTPSPEKQKQEGYCEVCDQKFKRIYDYRRHMRVHSKERPFKCSECGRGFTRKDNYNKHVDTLRGCKTKNDGRKKKNRINSF